MSSYIDHTMWSDPGRHKSKLMELPKSPVDLSDGLEEFLIHHVAAGYIGFGVPDYAESDRNLRTVSRILSTISERDSGPLSKQRELPNYFYGTCHDFSLMAVSAFRTRGVEARLRAGFVDYLIPGHWEDHWLCEYSVNGSWQLFDPQLGNRARESLGIDFDVGDVPRSRFKTAGMLWLALRNGGIDPKICGVSFAGIRGEWFPATSVLRDAAALAQIETLPWDFWGPARDIALTETVSNRISEKVDALALATIEKAETLESAATIYDQFPWAKPGETVLSFVASKLQEVSIF